MKTDEITPTGSDLIIRVDRSLKPNYPDWMEKLMHPELEFAGPAEYSLDEVDQWLHDDQKCGPVIGYTIYKYLQKGNELATCLNLQDGLAIQQKGIAVSRHLFPGKLIGVCLWGSVVQDCRGRLSLPYLFGLGGEVVLDWDWLVNPWRSKLSALRFKQQ